MFRSMFEEHIHYASALRVNRTTARSANALVCVVPPSNPADNCSNNALHNPLTTLMLDVTWKTNAAHPFTSHDN